MKLEEELEKVSRVLSDGFECKGRYCEHETSEKHYIVEKSLIEQFIINALESKMSDLRKEVVEEVMKIIEKHDPSTGRETSPRYWGNTLRDEVLLLMKKKIINSH